MKISSGNLRKLCIENNWFKRGTTYQYDKLFYANEHHCSIEEIATIIWLCSGDEVKRVDILDNLMENAVECND